MNMLVAPMVLPTNILTYGAHPFYYAHFVVEEIHERFTSLNKDSEVIVFKHYSLLMHLITFNLQVMNLWSKT